MYNSAHSDELAKLRQTDFSKIEGYVNECFRFAEQRNRSRRQS